jgi:23S rRNA (guanosine2251-2'-O)-methyltransferase
MVVKRRNVVNRERFPETRERRIYGIHAVTAWLRAAPAALNVVYYDRRGGARLREMVELAAAAGVRREGCSDENLTVLAGTARHQGVAATASPFPYVELDQLIWKNSNVLILADHVQDPHNLGALLMTAEAAAVGGVIIPKDSSVAVTPTVEVTAAGAAALVPLCRVTNTVRALEQLKERGYWNVGLVPHDGTDLYRFDAPERVVVVVGGEAGMRPLVAKHCDFTLSIPMFGRVESLNASVAAAIVLYELVRQRRALHATIVSNATPV